MKKGFGDLQSPFFAIQNHRPDPWAEDTSMPHTLGYYMHSGGHAVLPADYEIFVRYMLKHLVEEK